MDPAGAFGLPCDRWSGFVFLYLAKECFRMSLRSLLVSLLAILCIPLVGSAATKEEASAAQAANVLAEVSELPARGIPEALLRNAEAIAIIPGLVKGGLVIGGRHGRGVVMIREETGRWGFPVFIEVTGGSIGWQIGIQSIDLVLVFKTRRSLEGILEGKKFTLGADAAVAAGPVGRRLEAGTDQNLKAEIYSYSRARGLFAGISIDGAVIKIDESANSAFYGRRGVTADQIAAGEGIDVPEVALVLLETVEKYAPSAEFGQPLDAEPTPAVPLPSSVDQVPPLPPLPVPQPTVLPGPAPMPAFPAPPRPAPVPGYYDPGVPQR